MEDKYFLMMECKKAYISISYLSSSPIRAVRPSHTVLQTLASSSPPPPPLPPPPVLPLIPPPRLVPIRAAGVHIAVAERRHRLAIAVLLGPDDDHQPVLLPHGPPRPRTIPRQL